MIGFAKVSELIEVASATGCVFYAVDSDGKSRKISATNLKESILAGVSITDMGTTNEYHKYRFTNGDQTVDMLVPDAFLKSQTYGRSDLFTQQQCKNIFQRSIVGTTDISKGCNAYPLVNDDYTVYCDKNPASMVDGDICTMLVVVSSIAHGEYAYLSASATKETIDGVIHIKGIILQTSIDCTYTTASTVYLGNVLYLTAPKQYVLTFNNGVCYDVIFGGGKRIVSMKFFNLDQFSENPIRATEQYGGYNVHTYEIEGDYITPNLKIPDEHIVKWEAPAASQSKPVLAIVTYVDANVPSVR